MIKREAAEVAKLLSEFGRRTALAGGNPYRSRAYTRAAENLVAVAEPLASLVEQNRLREIPGVGDAIADIITKLHRTGTHPALEKMRMEVPEGVLDMLSIPGLRPEKAIKLYKELGVSSLDELESAARQDRLKTVKGLGPALQQKILQGLEMRRNTQGARHIHRAAALLAVAEQNLRRADPGLTRVMPAGDFRRQCELVSDLSLVAQTGRLEEGPKILRTGELSVHVTDARHFGSTLLFATGSEAHLAELCAHAADKGFALNEAGLRRGGKLVASKSETEIYKALGLSFIEPELREGRGEIARARGRRLPKLVSNDDIRGIMHAHTEASDGANTLQQMAEAARKRGYAYFGVADHSKSAHYAGGLTVAEIEQQHDAIERLNTLYDREFRVFKGIESDILADGSLDYPDDILRRFDFVVASVHSQFRMERKAQTERFLRAVGNPFVTVLGHMTGRQLLRRPGYEVDVDRILAACAQHDVAVEINANPWRLDLDWRWHQRGLELGCMFSINPDAHSMAEIDLTRWGVAMARKGGIPPERVLNGMELPAFAQWIEKRKRAAKPLSSPRGRAASGRGKNRRLGAATQPPPTARVNRCSALRKGGRSR
jgi:DNA polymerase (family 10)